MGGGSDLGQVRALMLSLAENGIFPTLGYSAQLSPELVREMDIYYQRLLAFTRFTLRKHADKVHALAQALMAKEELNSDEMAAILGPRPSERPKVPEQDTELPKAA